jgi:hypothetical protein
MVGLIHSFVHNPFLVMVVTLALLLVVALWLSPWADRRRDRRIHELIEQSRKLHQQSQAQVANSAHPLSPAPTGGKRPDDWRYARLFHWQYDLLAFLVIAVAIYLAHGNASTPRTPTVSRENVQMETVLPVKNAPDNNSASSLLTADLSAILSPSPQTNEIGQVEQFSLAKQVADDNSLLFTGFSGALSQPPQTHAESGRLWGGIESADSSALLEYADTSHRLTDMSLAGEVGWDRAGEIQLRNTIFSRVPVRGDRRPPTFR